MGLVFRRGGQPLQCHQNPASQLCCSPVCASCLFVQSGLVDASRRGLGRPAATYGLPVALSTALYASTCLLSNIVLLLASNSYGSSICACPTPVDPASPAHLPPAAEYSLQKQGGALESDSEPMVSDMIQQQLTDLCFREIGSWTDRISQKSMFHRDKQNVGSSSLKHYTFNNHMLHF